MRHIFIINPKSGNKQAVTYIPLIEDYFKSNPNDFEVLLTEYPGHATELARKYTKEDGVCVYSLSGDGTANEVLNGLNEGVTLAILPLGTGNDFNRMFQVPEMSMERLIIETIEGKECLVDYGMSNYRKFLNCSTMGLDADIGILAHEWKMKYPFLGSFSYIIAIFPLLIHRKPLEFTVRMDDKTFKVKYLLTAVMNGQFYGGGFIPTPMASIQDGYLDLCIIQDTNLLRILTLLPRYKKGLHINEDIVSFYKVKKFNLVSEREISTQCDGEVYPEIEIDFRIVEKGLRLRVPKESLLEEAP